MGNETEPFGGLVRLIPPVLQRAPLAVCVARRGDGFVEDANPAFLALFEQQPGQAVGRSLFDLGIWQSAEDRATAVLDLADPDSICDVRRSIRLPSGLVRHVVATAEALPGEEPATALVMLADVTDRVRADQRASAGEARERALVDAAPSGAFLADDTGRVLLANQEFLRITGARGADLAGKAWLDFVHPADRQRATAEWAVAVLKSPANYAGVLRFVASDGKVLLAKAAVREIRDGAKRSGFAGSLEDITAQKAAEERLKALSERLLLATKSANLGIWDWDVVSDRLNWNDQMLALYGTSRAAFEGKVQGWLSRVHPNDRASLETTLRQALKGERELSVEFRIPWTDGSQRVLRTYAVVQRNASGQPIRTIGTAWDVTELRRKDAALEEAKAAAEASSRAKSDFLANISHEIRTPLNAIIGMAELALDASPNPEQKNCLASVKRTGEDLLYLVNDILDLSKIEAGRLELVAESFPLREFLTAALRTVAPRGAEKNLELVLMVADDVPDGILGDPVRLRQVLIHLLANAVRFTERGEVLLKVGVAGTETRFLSRASGAIKPAPDAVVLHFSVSDTGIGIPAAKQKIIFDAFGQEDTAGARRHGGAGLGLAIAAKLVRLMGGEMWLDSEPSSGSCFHFSITLTSRPEAGEPTPGVLAHLAGGRALVVDDSATVRASLDTSLRSWGLNPETAATTQEALELADKAATTTPFVLVVVDATIPGSDSFDLARTLQVHPGLKGSIVMLLAASGLAAGAARCRSLGLHHFLVKPLGPNELHEALLNVAANPQPVPGQPDLPTPAQKDTATTQPRQRGLRLLLAEDNAVNREVAIRMLQRWGHTVTVAENGRQAVACLERDTFDVVLMDVQMPELDGIQATGVIRDKERGTSRHQHIIALTARAMKGDREQCLASGMDDYLAKPIRWDDLRARLEAFAESIAAAAAASATLASGPSHENLLEEFQGDTNLLCKVLEAFLQTTPALMQTLYTSLHAKDFPAADRAAHTIKGSVSHFHNDRAFELCFELEKLARARTIENAFELFDLLEKEINALSHSFEEWIARLQSSVT